MKIYVITKGDYSDYRICAVATDPTKADQLAEFFSSRYEPAEVEEYDTEDVPDLMKGGMVFCVHFSKRGEPIHIFQSQEKWDNNEINLHADGTVAMFVQADSKEAAIKIGAEKRAKFLAERMGL